MITAPIITGFKKYLNSKLDAYFKNVKSLPAADQPFFREVKKLLEAKTLLKNLNEEESIVLMLALVPHCDPNFFNSIITEYLPQGGDFAEFGGIRGTNHRGILPTGETAQFILAGNDLNKRLAVQQIFSTDNACYRKRIFWLETPRDGEPKMSGRIILGNDVVELLTAEAISKPDFSSDFPAKLITTKMEWSDLVVHPETAAHLEHIKIWLQHNQTLMKDEVLKRKIKPGYKALFFGPPGTGKTLTASLLGKYFDKDVYRIDLSTVVSKYIGETEKNLERVFAAAEQKNWILFFDEADALFGKRSGVQSSHDKYANQEVSYLLQRVEDFNGLVILASNYKSNLDAAFIRRFNAIVPFPMPNADERYSIWIKSLPSGIAVDTAIDWKHISKKYEVTGSSILNIIHHISLKAVAKKEPVITASDLLEGIRREFEKEDKLVN